MSKSTVVYQNNTCIVSVEIRPSDVSSYHPLYARVSVYIRNDPEKSSSSTSWECRDHWKIVCGDTPKTWLLRWQRWRKRSETHTTQEERLQSAVVDAVRFADDYEKQYLADMASAREALSEASHQIDALREVGLLEAGQVDSGLAENAKKG